MSIAWAHHRTPLLGRNEATETALFEGRFRRIGVTAARARRGRFTALLRTLPAADGAGSIMVELRCGAVAVGWAYLFPPLSSGGASLAQPWLRFHIPLIEPDVRICRVAQPLLAFAPTDPTVRRYRSGLFRTDLRRIDHLCQA